MYKYLCFLTTCMISLTQADHFVILGEQEDVAKPLIKKSWTYRGTSSNTVTLRNLCTLDKEFVKQTKALERVIGTTKFMLLAEQAVLNNKDFSHTSEDILEKTANDLLKQKVQNQDLTNSICGDITQDISTKIGKHMQVDFNDVKNAELIIEENSLHAKAMVDKVEYTDCPIQEKPKKQKSMFQSFTNPISFINPIIDFGKRLFSSLLSFW